MVHFDMTTVKELLSHAKEQGYKIPGASKMRKAELYTRILEIEEQEARLAELKADEPEPTPAPQGWTEIEADDDATTPGPADGVAADWFPETPGAIVTTIDGVHIQANEKTGMVIGSSDRGKLDGLVEAGHLEKETVHSWYSGLTQTEYFLPGPQYRGYETVAESEDKPASPAGPGEPTTPDSREMLARVDRKGNQEEWDRQRAILEPLYPDYSPARHKAYVDEYNMATERANFDEWVNRRLKRPEPATEPAKPVQYYGRGGEDSEPDPVRKPGAPRMMHCPPGRIGSPGPTGEVEIVHT